MNDSQIPLSVSLQTSVEDLADALCVGNDEATKALILAIDLRIADVGFTEEIIKALCASIRKDYAGTDDYAGLLAELAEVGS